MSSSEESVLSSSEVSDKKVTKESLNIEGKKKTSIDNVTSSIIIITVISTLVAYYVNIKFYSKEKPVQAPASSIVAVSNSQPKQIQEQNISKDEVQLEIKKPEATQIKQAKVIKQIEQIKDTASSGENKVVKTEKYTTPYNLVVPKGTAKVSNILKCYDMKSQSANITSASKKSLNAFMEKNKDGKYFEIVGVVGASDMELVNSLKGIDSKTIEKYKKIVASGIAQLRANEIAWYMRSVLGDGVTILPVSYPAFSKKVSKGVVVRAYR